MAYIYKYIYVCMYVFLFWSFTFLPLIQRDSTRTVHLRTDLFDVVSQSENVIRDFENKKNHFELHTIYLKANLQVHLFVFPAMKIH